MNARVVAAIARKDIVDAVRNRYLLFALLTPLMVAHLAVVLGCTLLVFFAATWALRRAHN